VRSWPTPTPTHPATLGNPGRSGVSVNVAILPLVVGSASTERACLEPTRPTERRSALQRAAQNAQPTEPYRHHPSADWQTDGCRHSNIYVPLDALPVAQAAIDQGARDAEHDPANVRRIYNVIGTIDGADGIGLHGSAKRWAETLANSHRKLGFDTFIFWPFAHGNDQLECFATESTPTSGNSPSPHNDLDVATSDTPTRRGRPPLLVHPSHRSSRRVPGRLSPSPTSESGCRASSNAREIDREGDAIR
jgi:hypothetical protein